MTDLVKLFERGVIALEKLAVGLGGAPVTRATDGGKEAGQEAVQPAATPRGRGRPPGTTKEAQAAKAAAIAEAKKHLGEEPENEFADPEPEPEAETTEAGEDDWPADEEPETETVEEITKEVMRAKLHEYQKLTDGKTARAFLAANTSTKSESTGTVKPAEYGKVYKATIAAIAKLAKK